MMKLKGNPVAHLTEYELHHLAEHLEASERVEELHNLLALETKEQHNAWYEIKEAIGHQEGYIANVARAWHLAERVYDFAQSADSLGEALDYNAATL